MASDSSNIEGAGGVLGAFDPVASARDYLIDLSQRSVLFWDVMRQRGNGYLEHEAKTVPACAALPIRTCDRRPHAGAPRQLRARSHRAARGRHHRPEAAALRHRGSARGSRPRHRRLQGGQRDRRRAQGGTPLLLRGLFSGPHAGADDRRHRARRSRVSRERYRAAPRGRGQTMRDRQLPSRLGGDDARVDVAPNCSARSS